MQLSESNYHARVFHDAEREAVIEAEFQLECEANNQRLTSLFLEARSIARQHPEWLAGMDARLLVNIKFILDNDTYPVVWRGQIVRTDPVPQGDDEFVAWVIERLNWEREMHHLEVDVKLSAESLRAAVSQKLFSFTDFVRNGKTGLPDSTNPDNVRVFLRMQQAELRWNDWFQRIEISELEPWGGARKPLPWAAVTDTVVGRLMTQAGDTQYQFRPAEQLFRRTIEAVAREDVYDPVKEYLANAEAKWDGTPRLATWLSRACGTPCDPYHQVVGKNVLGGMVKRAREPGAKHDEVMVLIGAQGTYKSTLCRTVAWRPEFFTDSVAFDGSPQNLVPQLFGKWIVELGELDGMASREVSYLKRFISAQSDNVTLKYKAMAADYERRCVFIGTTNDDRVLRDATGNRRFLPVRIERQIDVEWVRDSLAQLLGEAAAMHSAGANFTIPDEVRPAAQAHQEAARVEADFETHLEAWFGGDDPMLVAAANVAALLKEATGRSVPANKYGITMKRLGFLGATVRIEGKPMQSWVRGSREATHAVTLYRDNAGRLLPTRRAAFVPSVVPLPMSAKT